MKQILLVAILSALVGCSETRINDNPNGGFSSFTTPTQPTVPANPAPVIRKFEFRVNGNAQQIRVLYSTPNDGLVQVISAVPFSASFVSADTSLFLTMDVTPISFPVTVIYPFLTAQILVNDIVFRSANSVTFLSEPLSVSGTWRP